MGALWFYELDNPDNVYASGGVTFTGTPAFSSMVTVTIGDLTLTKLVHEGMTADMVALAYAIELNRGYTGIWASVSGNVLTIQTRTLGWPETAPRSRHRRSAALSSLRHPERTLLEGPMGCGSRT